VHGGQITIDSSIDKGTTMTIRLPVAEDAPVLSAES
jgi:signal transduction histidine kinase